METSARDADQLVEEGLALYSAGRFDAALGKWREALLLAPGFGRAVEYIDYVEANREALEQAYAENAAQGVARDVALDAAQDHPESRQQEGSHEVVAPFGVGAAAPEEQSAPGSFFEAAAAAAAGGPARGGAGLGEDAEQDPAAEWGVAPEAEPPPSRHRRHTKRSFVEPMENISGASDPFGADEPTPISLIEEEEVAPALRPTDSSPSQLTRDGLEPLEEEPVAEAAPQLRKAPPRAAGPGMPRRRAVGVPPPLPRGLVAAHDAGAMPQPQPMRASQPTPPLVGLDDLLTSDEAAAISEVAEAGDVGGGGGRDESSEDEIVVEAAPPSQSYEDLARQFIDDSGARVDTMLRGARELFAQGTLEGSLWLCQKILGLEPEHGETLGLLRRNQEILLGQYEQRLGDLEQVPMVRVSQGDIVWHKLDHRAGFLISRIDGMLSYNDILDISGMERFEAMRILAQLVEQGVVEASP